MSNPNDHDTSLFNNTPVPENSLAGDSQGFIQNLRSLHLRQGNKHPYKSVDFFYTRKTRWNYQAVL
jgi:hypothetical protein